jgi:hypothetical protein
VLLLRWRVLQQRWRHVVRMPQVRILVLHVLLPLLRSAGCSWCTYHLLWWCCNTCAQRRWRRQGGFDKVGQALCACALHSWATIRHKPGCGPHHLVQRCTCGVAAPAGSARVGAQGACMRWGSKRSRCSPQVVGPAHVGDALSIHSVR